MVGFFSFKKNQAGSPGPSDQDGVVVQHTTVTTQQQSQPQYYGGGQSYNGIGSPPAPPPPVMQQPTTTQTTVTKTQTPQGTVYSAQQSQQSPYQNQQAQYQNQPVYQNQPPQYSNQPPAQQNQPPAPSAQSAAPKSQNAAVPKPPAPPGAPKPGQSAVLNSQINDQKRGELDVMTHLTQRSNRVFMAANNKARELKNVFLDSEHLLHGLLTDGEIYKLFTDMKVQPQLIEATLMRVYKKEQSPKPPQIAPRIKRIVENSLIIARKLGFEFISPEHILLALYEEKEGVGAKILVKLGVKSEDLNKKVLGKKEGMLKSDSKAPAAKKTVMEQFTIDLTAKAAQGLLDPVVERSDVIERVIHILSRRTKNNPALVGEAGVGKTAVVEGLAQQIVAKRVPEPLLDKKILELDLMGILAGASHRGEFEERMKTFIEDIQNSQGKIIVFIDEIHTIVGAGSSGEGSIDVSNFLKPALARGELQLIGATTLTEYRKYIEKDPALERRFQPVLVPEPTEEAAIKMAKALRDKYEAFHRVKIPDEAVEAAVIFSKRYVGDRFLPDKAVDLIDESASAVRLPLISLPEVMKSLQDRATQLMQEQKEAEAKNDRVKVRIIRSKLEEVQSNLREKKEEYDLKRAQTTSSVSIDIIKDVVSRWTGVPVNKISSSEMDRLANLEKIMHQRLIGQERAVTVVAQAVKRGRAGLKSQSRPIGSFVFLGPTGVGKTELAKTLAEVLFDQEEAMIRFDMTEYMEKHEVAKLLGAPPGYVGYEEGGKLTEAVRRRPYSVVLFDEVEKAHPDIFNILLQILDDGRLTDNKGHVISFKNTVIIATSNIGSKVIQDELLKNGKGEVEEPPAVSTYTFFQTGREILTIGSKYFIRVGKGVIEIAEKKKEEKPEKPKILLTTYAFSPRGRELVTIDKNVYERDQKPSDNNAQPSWTKKAIAEYFTGQQSEIPGVSLPTQHFDTHAISAKGMEMISAGNMIFSKTSTTSKIWNNISLIDYFKDNVVINALPDAPDEQLPTAKFSTHAFSSDEMEIVTYNNRFWRRKEQTTDWETGLLKDYFTGQTITEGHKFPETIWTSHTFTPTGSEIIVSGEDIWTHSPEKPEWQHTKTVDYFGDNPPVKEEKKPEEAELKLPEPVLSENWKSGMLFDYFAGQEIKTTENVDPDAARAEFPSQGYETQTITPKGGEMITKGNMIYERDKTTDKIWKAMSLIDYFRGQTISNAMPDAPEEQLPTVKLKSHAFSPDGLEIVTYKDRFWKRKTGMNIWETGQLQEYFDGQEIPGGSFPITHWDIHVFAPDGREIIIVGENVWFREAKQKAWKHQNLKEYFGDDFPLDHELDEKQKIEEETDKKRYDIIKEKVMNELRKFFRPELINRFDEVIVFEPLKFAHMMKIVKIQLKALGKLLEDQDMDFTYTEAAQKAIVREGFDPVFGARPLRRAVQKLIENPISSMIIEKKAVPGDTIVVDFDGVNLTFDVSKTALLEEKKELPKFYFTCEVCSSDFETAVLPTATTVCAVCGSPKVHKKKEEEKKKEDIKDDKKNDNKEAKKAENKEVKKEPEQENKDQKKQTEAPQEKEPVNKQPEIPPAGDEYVSTGGQSAGV